MKIKPLAIGIPVLAMIGAAIVIWYMHARQKADVAYHASLTRSIQVSSEAFEDYGHMPVEFSPEGDPISPPLKWSNLPKGTRSLVLLVTDVDLPTHNFSLFQIVHWVLYNIPTDVTGLDAGITDADLDDLEITTGQGWAGETGYVAPDPISGTHRYVFRLYALNVDTIQPKTNDRKGVLKAMENHVIAYGELNGLYTKSGGQK